MDIDDFSIARLPRIEFGRGKLSGLAELAAGYGRSVLLVTGRQAFLSSVHWPALKKDLQAKKLSCELVQITNEPSPQLIDEIVRQQRQNSIDAVIGIGGGSVLDAAKAIAGLLRIEHSVMDFLEGVGPELPYPGPAVPFIAIPTTAGTGSEATKNAVLSVCGKDGFKKSFRHDRLVAEYAILDPQLLASCPPAQIAANGMDALTQLLESVVSTRSNPMTEALAISGLRLLKHALPDWYQNGADATKAQATMAYAALQSGICLAQTGLGSVHGLAAPLGAFHDIPHGEVCGLLLAACTRANIDVMQQRDAENPALAKYAELGRLLTDGATTDDEQARQALVRLLDEWSERFQMPRLSDYGVTEADFPHIVAHCRGSSMKTNPVVLTDDEIAIILQQCL